MTVFRARQKIPYIYMQISYPLMRNRIINMNRMKEKGLVKPILFLYDNKRKMWNVGRGILPCK
ncbi:hypothetical protein GCM10007140_11150 [Priestia taiwanensis]|uniref:Uncharacterized protein n=1 Tax=Priestia taiwanensis TaxID=1347902 RepID=A0A917AQE5_9BACI|nr:hypothetical protein GCM10007140_11150 [Priestia taiwanensis]